MHPDRQVDYYCLDCEVGCVCADCVIYGSHRGHSVERVDKAVTIVRAKLGDLLEGTVRRMEEISIMEAKILTHREEVIANTQAINESMQQSFAEVRERLRRKEEELLRGNTAFCEAQVAQLDEYTRAARERIEQVDLAVEIIRARLANDGTVSLINYYADNKAELRARVEDMVPIPDLPQVSNRKAFLDMDATNSQIEALNGLHLIIATLSPNEDPLPQSPPRHHHQQQQQQQQIRQHHQQVPVPARDSSRSSMRSSNHPGFAQSSRPQSRVTTTEIPTDPRASRPRG